MPPLWRPVLGAVVSPTWWPKSAGRPDGRDVVRQRKRRTEEQAWQKQVEKLARMFHWRHYHTWLSLHSAAGFPDLILVKPPRLIAAELKRDGEQPTADQRAWLADLAACGVECYVWRPRDAQTVADILQGELR